MDPFRPTPPRDLATVERAIRHALEHADASGDQETAAELTAILEAIRLRQVAAQGGNWDTVPASGRMQ